MPFAFLVFLIKFMVKLLVENFRLLFISFKKNFYLICQLGKRQISGRYRGSFLGVLWSFINPLLLLGIYAFVFGFVFQAKFGANLSGNKSDFAIILFTGLIIHQFFAECLSKAPDLVVSNANYVKKIIFPLEILPWSVMFSALFHLMISFIVLLLFYFSVHLSFYWTVIFFPLVLLPLVIITMGISWFLSAVGVFFRDMNQFIGFIVTICLFLSPTFYPVTNIPLPFRYVLYLNPITFIITQVRSVVLDGQIPDWYGLSLYLLVAMVIAILGLSWFQKVRHIFADTI